MNSEPRDIVDYNRRQVEAARRVLVDLGQVLASFADCMVLIGGWVPDLLLVDAMEPHVGSIDVDIALDAAKLGNGRYAELLKLLLDTRRYYRGRKDFQLIADVDLGDGEPPVQVEVEFLAPSQVRGSESGEVTPGISRKLPGDTPVLSGYHGASCSWKEEIVGQVRPAIPRGFGIAGSTFLHLGTPLKQ